MKTNIAMESVKDRELFGVVIHQNTNNSMLSLTDLKEAYVHARIQNGWKSKDVSKILDYEDNIDRIFYILKEQNVISDNTQLIEFYEDVKEKGITKVLKKLNVYKVTGKGESKRTVCNPYIWVLVAIELNPMMYEKVSNWLPDTLILNRIEAGNFYKELSSALYKLPEKINYLKLAETLNKRIFGKHEYGIRNKGSKEELERLYILEANIAYVINKGYLKTQDEVIKAIIEY